MSDSAVHVASDAKRAFRCSRRTNSDKTSLAVEFDEKKIDALFAELDQCRLPGAAVGIALGGTPVYRKGFGLANMELPILLSPTIRMRMGSATKHFACLAYMLLCENGKARIDDPIGMYLPELHQVTHEVTLRQLMGHLSGLRDVYEISLQFSGAGRRVSSAELLALYRDIDDVNCAPGTAWIYNNGAYLMLTAAIERITGHTLEDVLHEFIFAPVGMHDTMLRRWDFDFVPNSATLHMTNAAGVFEKSYYGTDFAGAGAMVSTVNDMLRWLAHMDAPVVGNASTWANLKAPQRLANGVTTGYGLGLISAPYRGVDTLFHPGGWSGGNAQMLKVPAAGLDIVVMVNRHDVLGMQLVGKILDVCLSNLDPVTEVSYPRFASGTFRSLKTGRVIQLFAKEGQQIVSIDGYDWTFAHETDGALRPPPIWSYMKREVALNGDPERPNSIRFSDWGTLDELIREKPAEESEAGRILGRYRSDATGTEVTIYASEKGTRMTTVGRFGSAHYDLECLATGIWRVKQLNTMSLSGIITLDSDGNAFHFSSWNTRALPFRRDAGQSRHRAAYAACCAR